MRIILGRAFVSVLLSGCAVVGVDCEPGTWYPRDSKGWDPEGIGTIPLQKYDSLLAALATGDRSEAQRWFVSTYGQHGVQLDAVIGHYVLDAYGFGWSVWDPENITRDSASWMKSYWPTEADRQRDEANALIVYRAFLSSRLYPPMRTDSIPGLLLYHKIKIEANTCLTSEHLPELTQVINSFVDSLDCENVWLDNRIVL